MRPIHNYPVVPEEGEHSRRSRTRPVTRSELKCDFRTAIFLYSPKDEIDLKALLEGVLTPLGRLHAEAQEVAYDHPVRGVPYMPVALMLDYDHGWNQPRHLYRKDKDHVWGNIPYSRLDHQIDNFFRWVYPGYEVCSYYRDERGYITNTPYGDLFEVVLSNASPTCLEKYRAVVLMGDLKVEGREGLAQRLTDFLRGGGIVVAGTDQWPGIPETLAGVSLDEGTKMGEGEVVCADGRRFREAAFEYRQARAAGRGFLPLMFRDIDWKRLGVGVPEVDLRNHPGRRMGHF